MKRNWIKVSFALFFLFSPGLKALSQYHNTLYWLQGIPQSTYANPALMPQARIFVGMPFLSSEYLGIGNSGFALRDFLRKNENDEFYWDEDHMISKLGKHGSVGGVVQLELLSFGFRSKSNYLSFSINENMGSHFNYPSDFIRLIFKGNDHFLQENRAADFSGLEMEFFHYREFGLGFSREINEQLNAGIRVKLLQGMSGFWFERSELSLNTAPDYYNLLINANLLVNVSSPVPLSPLDSLDENFEFEPDVLEYLTNTGNMGGSVDLGITYKPIPRLTLAVSALNLGAIHWKKGAENFQLQGEFEFQGIELEDLFSDDEDNGNGFENLLDSLENNFDITETTRSFRQKLPAQLYASAAFELGSRHSLALLNRNEFYKGHWYPSFTVSYIVKPIHAFSLALSYSVIHWNYTNMGVGFNLNLGPLQFYLVSNNVFGAIQPHTFQGTSVHTGFNWVFGYRPKKEQVLPSISL